jgi:hypothetical protein
MTSKQSDIARQIFLARQRLQEPGLAPVLFARLHEQIRDLRAELDRSAPQVPTTCIKHGSGGTLRLSYQIKVF